MSVVISRDAESKQDAVHRRTGTSEIILDTKLGNSITKDGVVSSIYESDTSLSTNVFADPEVAAHYREVYEKADYECRHVFDPSLEWSAAEEKKLVRKLDWHVCLWAVSDLPAARECLTHDF